jgi:protein O-GlcNAc transferase
VIKSPVMSTDQHSEELHALRHHFDHQEYGDAERLARALIAKYPDLGLPRKILGLTLRELGRADEALASHKVTAKIFAEDYEAHFNLAVECLLQGMSDDAATSFGRAIEIQPNNPIAYCKLGEVYTAMGKLEKAESCVRQAIELQPDMATAHHNLGKVLHAQGKHTESIGSYRRALALNPNWAEAHNNLAISLMDQGNISEAQRHFREAIALKPDWAAAHSNFLYCLNLDVQTTPDQLHTEHVAFGRKFETALRKERQPHTNDMDPARVIHVGFVSGDLHEHGLASFLEPAFEGLAEKADLVLHAYCNHLCDDSATKRMRNSFAHWHCVAELTDDALADRIRADGIDILFDLSGHTSHNRLLTFARKPAPIQVSWLGYLGTSGLDAMDYYLCDDFWIPPGELDWQFTEKLAYLSCSAIFEPNPRAPSVNALPARQNGYLTFGSFNQVSKVNESVIALWSMVLHAAAGARLILTGLEPESQSAVKELFAEHGILASQLSLYPLLPTADYLAVHAQVDICLDTFPHGGGATTAQAAWMGLPTMCLAGETAASRFSATLMHQLGLDEFITSSIEDYVSMGGFWANQIDKLSQIRQEMRERYSRSPLSKPEAFADNFTDRLRAMWQKRCATNVSASGEATVVNVISATRLSEEDFWHTSALGISLAHHLREDPRLSACVTFNNTRGLPSVFNEQIDQAEEGAILIFVHDDVWLDEPHLVDVVEAGLEHFDVVGVAGNRRRVANQPGWLFINEMLTVDVDANLSARVSHGDKAFGTLSAAGVVPAECELLDGLFLATKKRSLTVNNISFDPQFDFHFYDMDFCRAARKAGLKLGTWLIGLTHQSGGSFGSKHWREKYRLYLNKWEDYANIKAISDIMPVGVSIKSNEAISTSSIPSSALTSALVNLAQGNEILGNQVAAACLYSEALKLTPDDAYANFHLGLIEVKLKGAVEALPRFEAAIQSQPMEESHWVAYINALVSVGSMETAASALEWGQKYGLRKETAATIAANCVAAVEKTLNGAQLNESSAYTEEQLARPPAPKWPAIKSSLTANLDYINEPKSKGRRYVIFAPLFRNDSSGIRVLFDLQKWLICAGYDAITIAGTTQYKPDQFADDIIIYPEVVTGNPLNSKRVVRYLLNFPGKLAGTKAYAKHELLVSYSDTFCEHSNGEILMVPPVEPFFFSDDTPKTHNAIYVGKEKDLGMHPKDCIYITRQFPVTRREVAQFMRATKTLYTYDLISAIGHEAMLCGCQVKHIQPDGTIVDFPPPVTILATVDAFKKQLHDFIEVSQRL